MAIDNTLRKITEPLVKRAKSTQEFIDIMKVAKDGILEVYPGKYSVTYKFDDVNFCLLGDEEKIEFFNQYCSFLKSFGSGIEAQITTFVKPRNLEIYDNNVIIEVPSEDDGFNYFRQAINDNIRVKLANSYNGLMQEKYITITINRRTYKEAGIFFNTLEDILKKGFESLGSVIRRLNGDERLTLLQSVYQMDEEAKKIDLEDFIFQGRDFINDLVPSIIDFKQFDRFRMGKKYGKVFYIKSFPTEMDDDFMYHITHLPFVALYTTCMIPCSKEYTNKLLENKYMGIEEDIRKQQQKRNQNNDFSSEISYKKRREKEEIEIMMDDVRQNDEKMFYVGTTICAFADSQEELNSISLSLKSVAEQYSIVIEDLWLNQREGFNSTIPLGVRQIDVLRSFFTHSMTALQPFMVKDLMESGASVFYGINPKSFNPVIGNRKKLPNGNGMVFSGSGGGKSFFVKGEMSFNFFKTEDDFIIIDPQGEYFEIANIFNGTVVELSSLAKQYMNPLECNVEDIDFNKEVEFDILIKSKSSFITALVSKFLVGTVITGGHLTIIDDCVTRAFHKMAMLPKEERRCLIMGDIYKEFMEYEDDGKELSREIALSLRLFVTGSLDIFNHQTNIDMNNRVIVFNLSKLSEDLRDSAMLVMIESIRSILRKNLTRTNMFTWIYVDEFHNLLKDPLGSGYMLKLWKEIRKEAGIMTGITQNITEVVNNENGEMMLSNSEFVCLLRQSEVDAKKLLSCINGITPNLLDIVKKAVPGTGLIKHGDIIVPWDNRISKDNFCYKCYNTDPESAKTALGV